MALQKPNTQPRIRKPKIPAEPYTEPTATLIDFSQTPLSSCYTGHFALTIDNLFSAKECESLLTFATSHNNGVWDAATIQAGPGPHMLVLNKEIRNSGRIMVDDFEVADMLFKRIEPYLKEYELEFVGRGGSERWRGVAGDYNRWRLKRMNERLRFLKYTPGGYFKPHYDGMYTVPGGEQRSFITFQLYLGGTCEGGDGSTRFLSYHGPDSGVIDVEPTMGRVLLFQHSGLVHEGSNVTNGEKYTLRSDIMYEKVQTERPSEESEVLGLFGRAKKAVGI